RGNHRVALEAAGDYADRGFARFFQQRYVVDKPRRASPSIAGGDDEDVALLLGFFKDFFFARTCAVVAVDCDVFIFALNELGRFYERDVAAPLGIPYQA